MLDCDHFKAVNDRWGHDAGDEVLSALVRICGENTRGTDDGSSAGAARSSCCCCPRTGPDIALAVAERLRRAIEAAKIRE